MKATNRTVHVRFTAAFLGLGLGIHLAAAGLVAGGVLMGARTASAAEDTGLCMAQAECIDPAVAKDGNCDGKHCFEAGHGCTSGQGYCYAKWAPAQLSVSFGGTTKVADLGDYIVKAYDWSMGVAAVMAAVMMMFGGFMVMSSAGNAGMAKKGMQKLLNALIGLALVAGAYTILQTVNPDLVRFKLPKFPTVKRSFMVMCTKFQKCYPCGVKFYVMIPKGTAAQDFAKGGLGSVSDAECNKSTTTNKEGIDTTKFEASSECYGNSCSMVAAACGDAFSRCSPAGTGDKPADNCLPGATGGSFDNACKVQVNYNTCMQDAGWVFSLPDNIESQPAADANKVAVCRQKLSDCMVSNQGKVLNATSTNCNAKSASEKAACEQLNAATQQSAANQDQLVLNADGSLSTVPSALAPNVNTSSSGTVSAGVDKSGITNGYFCKNCVMNGDTCTGNDKCCSNKCVNNYGSQIGSALNKTVGEQGIVAGKMVCASGELGSPCASTSDCNTGVCNTSLFRGMCTTGAAGSPCNDDGECVKPNVCSGGTCGSTEDYSYCDSNSQCKGNSCDTEMHVCKPADGFKECKSKADCADGQICSTGGVVVTTSTTTASNASASAYGAGSAAVAVTQTGKNVCMTGASGSPCHGDTDCSSFSSCVGGRCSERLIGQACNSSVAVPCADINNKCICAAFWGDKCFCQTGSEGSPCEKTDHCRSGLTCFVTGGGSGQRGLGVCRK